MYNDQTELSKPGGQLGQSRPPSILERMVQREEKAHQHSAALDNHADRLRRIENALGLDPLPQNDIAMPPMQSFNY